MRRLSSFLVLCISLTLLVSFAIADDANLVIEFFRHGARGPISERHDPVKKWGIQEGQLTPVGMRMHYLLGRALRERYGHLLTTYNASQIFVRSTDVNRTIMSAQSHLSGAFYGQGPTLGKSNERRGTPPYKSKTVWETVKALKNQTALPDQIGVFPIRVVQPEQDYLLRSYDACLAAKTWSNESHHDDEVKEMFEVHMKDTVNYLKEQKNFTAASIDDLYYIGDNSLMNSFENITNPFDIPTDSKEWKDLTFISEWLTVKMYWSKFEQAAVYAINPLLEVVERMEAYVQGKQAETFVFFSAHDTTLMVLLGALNITNKDCMWKNHLEYREGRPLLDKNCYYPKLASNIIFEFYNTSDPYMVFEYDGQPISLCGKEEGNGVCKLSEFKETVKKVTMGYSREDYFKQCKFPGHEDPQPQPQQEETKSDSLMILLIIANSILFILLGVMLFMFRSKKQRRHDRGESQMKLLTGSI